MNIDAAIDIQLAADGNVAGRVVAGKAGNASQGMAGVGTVPLQHAVGRASGVVAASVFVSHIGRRDHLQLHAIASAGGGIGGEDG
jgi:hypothetical protein